ncbi:MAG TPA: porin [Burkholderiales bacterium]
MHSKGAVAAGILFASSLSAPAWPAEFKITDDATFNAGIGLRASYSRTDFGAPDGVSKSNKFSVESARLFLGGSYAKMFKATLNTERGGDDKVRLLDGIAQFEPMPEFNVWIGRMLPPSDRANLYGPYYAVPWSFPGVVSNYPSVFAGRDNGLTIWGKPLAGKLTYAVGAFDGHNKVAGLSGQTDKMLFSGRLAYAFWDPEPAPAYYTGGWYGGSKNILTVGLAGQSQKDGVGTAAAPGKLSMWSLDVLAEKKLAAGVPTFEAAFYKYSLGAPDCGSGEPGAPACLAGENVGGQVDGKATLLGGAWLIPQTVGWGQLQPFVRFQRFKRTLSSTTAKEFDIGVNYLIRGPNTRLTAQYGKLRDDRVPAPRDAIAQLVFGAQLMF